MVLRRTPWLLPLALLLVLPSIYAETFTSGARRTNLLELYTSEGCSSCPRADQWVSGLTEAPDLWSSYVPVVFHVGYWDYLGWKDRFASPAFTERQRVYARLWQEPSIYTPCFAVAGRPWPRWFRSKTVPKSDNKEVGVLAVKAEDEGRYEVAFTPAEQGKEWRAYGALLGFDLSSDVRAGENRGRNLNHQFVVLSYESGIMKPHADKLAATVTLKAPSDVESKRYAVATWVTKGNDPTPVQATGGYLP
ncbi:MAG: DUF1223 domain-containing protein [Candidatus Omnitrophota bacterium]|nr:DUF1223 domain-containing protein [Candidatus Omnitrophota bacterium]